MTTLRRHMLDLLTQREWDARGLSQALGIREKEVYSHLPHIQRTAAALGKTLRIVPARCAACGYAFAGRKKISRPGRCPRCRQERINPPLFHVTDASIASPP